MEDFSSITDKDILISLSVFEEKSSISKLIKRHLLRKQCEKAPSRWVKTVTVRGSIWWIRKTVNYFWLRKYAQIVVLGHYLFLEAHSCPRVNCLPLAYFLAQSSLLFIYPQLQLEPLEKEWMLTLARGNRAQIMCLLEQDPNLAGKKVSAATLGWMFVWPQLFVAWLAYSCIKPASVFLNLRGIGMFTAGQKVLVGFCLRFMQFTALEFENKSFCNHG